MKTEQGSIQLDSQTFEAVKIDFDSYSRETGNIILQRLNCPHEYQEVEYIQNNGNAYFNSHILSDKLNTFDTKIQLLEPAIASSIIYGGRYSSYNSVNIMSFVFSAKSMQIGCGDTVVTVDELYNYDIQALRTDTNNRVYVNDTYIVGMPMQAADKFYNPRDVYIYAVNTNGTMSTSYSPMKMFYMKIYRQNQILRDYVPCYRKSDKVVGMWDKVSNVFFTNEGPGEFIAGPAIPCEDQSIFESTKVSGQ